eukprot:5390073-Ditylum_brightwellii.AAC.1
MQHYDFYLDNNDLIWKVQHMVRAKKKKGHGPQPMDAMAKKVKTLTNMDCFELCKKGMYPRKITSTQLFTWFLMQSRIYDGISVKLLHVIAHSACLDALCGDIGNAYVNTYTTEKVYAVAGLEFGEENVGTTMMILKDVGPPEYYLENNYKRDVKGRWNIGCEKYITKAISQVEHMLGKLLKHDIPMVTGDHLEEDDSTNLNDTRHQQYQMLLGMLNW